MWWLLNIKTSLNCWNCTFFNSLFVFYGFRGVLEVPPQQHRHGWQSPDLQWHSGQPEARPCLLTRRGKVKPGWQSTGQDEVGEDNWGQVPPSLQEWERRPVSEQNPWPTGGGICGEGRGVSSGPPRLVTGSSLVTLSQGAAEAAPLPTCAGWAPGRVSYHMLAVGMGNMQTALLRLKTVLKLHMISEKKQDIWCTQWTLEWCVHVKLHIFHDTQCSAAVLQQYQSQQN